MGKGRQKQWHRQENKASVEPVEVIQNDSEESVQVQDAVAMLSFMIEEEKMARDLYDALYDQTGLKIFDRISDSEQKHMETLLVQADKLGIDTEDLSLETAGVFANEELQSLYDSLLESGSQSLQDALRVGVLVEETDIADLEQSISSSDDLQLIGVYESLLNASENHLSAFNNWLA